MSGWDDGRLQGAVRDLLEAWEHGDGDLTADLLKLKIVYRDLLRGKTRELSHNEVALKNYLDELDALYGMRDEA